MGRGENKPPKETKKTTPKHKDTMTAEVLQELKSMRNDLTGQMKKLSADLTNFQRDTNVRWPTRAKHNSILSWIHNNLSWYKTIFRGTQKSFVIENNFSRNTTIFRDTKEFFHGTQQSFVMQNNFSRYITIFGETKQFFTEHNNLPWCKTIFHETQQSFVI